jgi:hypothetical protein
MNYCVLFVSKSFQDVQSVQSDIWNYQQYAVVREYYDRPPLFIPFSTIFDIIALIKICYQWYLRVRYNYVNPLQRVFSKLWEKILRIECLFFCIVEVIAVQPELELVWQEFESASTYAYAQREALTKMDRSGKVESLFLPCTVFDVCRAAMESEVSVREIRSTDVVESSTGITKNDKDSIRQLRNEFKTAIKDLRNDVCIIISFIMKIYHFLFYRYVFLLNQSDFI